LNELVLMERFGWTYEQLQATPEDVVSDAVAYLNAQVKRREVDERRAEARARMRR